MTTIKTQKFSLIGKYQDESLENGTTNSSWVDYSIIAYDENHAKEIFETETGESFEDYHVECTGYARGQLSNQYFEPKINNNNS